MTWLIANAGANNDAFGRPRSSAPKTFFNSDFEYDASPLWFVSSSVGTGSVEKTSGEASILLSTGGTASGAGVVYQTKQYFRYEPGKGRFVVFSGYIGAQSANTRQRLGNFDSNNGVFFEMDGTLGMSVNQRSNTSGSVVDTKYLQMNWNIDCMNGTGPSGVTLDFSKTQLMWIDFQWMGTGHSRFGFFVNGYMVAAHDIYNDNVITSPYTNTATLPMRAEIFNTGVAAGSTNMKWICCSLVNEGSPEIAPSYLRFTASNNTTSIAVAGTPIPILSIQPKTTFASQPNRIHNVMEQLAVECVGGNSCFYELVYNGTLTGASFVSVDPNSGMNYDTAATAISGGTVVASGYATSASQMIFEALDKLQLPFTLDYTGTIPDTYSIVCQTVPGIGPTTSGLTFTSSAAPNPAAGASCILTVPAGQQWKLYGINFSVATSTATAARTAFITAKDASGRTMLQAFAADTNAAGQVCVLSFGPGESSLTNTVDFVYLTEQMGSIILGPGATLTVNFINMQSGDQISGVTAMIETSPSFNAPTYCNAKLSWIELR